MSRRLDAALFLDLEDLDGLVLGRTTERRLGANHAGTPIGGLIGAPEFVEHLGIRREQGGAVRECAIWVELRNLELGKGEFGLALVESGTRHRDGEAHLHGDGQFGPIDRTTDLECAVGTTDAALAVDHERKLVVAARDPAVRAELAQREGEIPRRVGGDGERLADDGDAARAARS